MKRNEKILLGVGVFLLAGTVLYLFIENLRDEKFKSIKADKEEKPGSRMASNYIPLQVPTAEMLGEKSKLQAMKEGLIKTSMSNEEIDNRIQQLAV